MYHYNKFSVFHCKHKERKKFMIFNDLFFCFADASKEFMIEPILFEKSFL